MGGLCGSGTQKTEQVYTPNPQTQAFATSLIGQAGALPGPGGVPLQGVQSFSPLQNQAFGAVQSAQGVANPYFATAANLVNQGSAPLDFDAINRIYSATADPVNKSLQDLYGQQRSQNIGQLTQAAGGVGADRIGVAQANLAKQQSLAQGQTDSGLYAQALNSYLQQKQLQQAGGSLMGNLGLGAQGATYTDINALLGAGGMQQQLGQSGLNALFQQALGQYQNPYQNFQYSASLLPALQTGLGGTQDTTKTATQSPLQTILGLGTLGLGAFKLNPFGLFSADGGRIERSFGGGVEGGEISPYYQAPGMPPTVSGSAPTAFPSGSVGNPWEMAARAYGGSVGPYEAMQGFAEGGSPLDILDITLPPMSDFREVFNPRRNYVPGVDSAPPSAWGSGSLREVEPPEDRMIHALAFAGQPSGSDNPLADMAAYAPREAAGRPAGGSASGLPPLPEFAPREKSLAANPYWGLVQAGLGILGSDKLSPWAAIGEGGMKGFKTLEEQREAERRDREQALHETSLMEHARMARVPYSMMTAAQREAHDIQRQQMALSERRLQQPYEELTAAQKLEALKPFKIGVGADGLERYGIRDPKSGEIIAVDPNSGKPLSADTAKPIEAGVAGLTDEAITAAAERYLKTGVLPTGLARGTPGRLQVTAIQNRATELARERGIPLDELPKKQQQFRAEQVAIQRFQSGPQGNTIRFIGNAVEHLDTLGELSKALKNGNFNPSNLVYQKLREQFGNAAPTDFETAKRFVGPEIIKALGVTGAGTEKERSEILAGVTTARSPEQIEGALNVARSLLRPQLQNLRRQFVSSTGLPDSRFDELLPPSVAKGLGGEGAPKKDAGARFKELIGSGKSKQEAFQIMKSEGF